MRKFLSLTFTIILLLMTNSAFALIPLESLVLGDFSEEMYKSDKNDPLDYVYQTPTTLKSETSKDEATKKKMAIYRGYYEEGRNLDNLCKSRPQVRYNTPWDRQQVKLSMLATLQYIGLDITTRALGKYAKELNYSEDEYTNIVENLVGNYCSTNTSVISLKTLKKNLYLKYEKENSFQLPTIENNFTFSRKFKNQNTRDQILEQELKTTVKLFQAFCSWGTQPENYRLLVPLVRSPIVQAFIIRQMSNKNLIYNRLDNKIIKKINNRTVKVACQGLICRKVLPGQLDRKLAKGIGHESLEEDLKRLYCQDLRDADFTYKGQEQKIKQMIDGLTFDAQAHMVGQFVALMTGVPDFFIRSDSFSDGNKFAKYSMDNRWQKWADKKMEAYNNYLHYEEPLTLEVVNRKLYFNRFKRDFNVHVDVNVGEFDRTLQIVGKISASFNLTISRKFLSWARKEWRDKATASNEEKKKVLKRFVKIIEDQVSSAKKKFDLPPWESGLEEIVAAELLEQLALYEGPFFKTEDLTFEVIPVYLNYGPFALKYMQYLHKANIEKNEYKSF